MRIDHFALVVALDTGARPGHDIGELDQLLGLGLGELVLCGTDVGDESASSGRQFGAHLDFLPGIANGLPCRAHASLIGYGIGSNDDEAVAHDSDDAVCSIPGSGAGTDNDNTTSP